MKKITILLCVISMSYTAHAAEAFQPPTALGRGIVDDIIETAESVYHRFKKDGIAHIWNSHSKTPNVFGLRLAVPIWTDSYSLCRLEANVVRTQDNTVAWPCEEHLSKLGLSGRRIVHPDLIVGLYRFYDAFSLRSYEGTQPTYFINTGVEILAPRYASLTLDTVFKSSNVLFTKSNDHYYQHSVRIALTKPRVLDIGIGAVYSQYSKDAHYWRFIMDCKGSINRWHFREHVFGGLGLTYDQKPLLSWFSIKNLGFSIYLQIDLTKQKLEHSLRDYLRAPIDRSIATPYHPNIRPTSSDHSAFEDDTGVSPQVSHKISMVSLPPNPIEE